MFRTAYKIVQGIFVGSSIVRRSVVPIVGAAIVGTSLTKAITNTTVHAAARAAADKSTESDTSSSSNAPSSGKKPYIVRAPITERDVKHFVDEGYIVVEDLLTPSEVKSLQQDLVAIARGKYPNDTIPPAPAHLTDKQVAENILCVHMPHQISSLMKDFVSHPTITDVLGRITGAHLAHWDGSVKAMQTMAFVKSPNKPGQAWHQDERYIPTRDRSLTAAWIALDDATVDNGCLWVIPGSHRSGYIYPHRKPTDLNEYDGSDQSYGFDEENAVPVPIKAGSVVFFNGYLLHRSLKNRTSGYRRALAIHYMNSYSLLPWRELPPNPDGTVDTVACADVRRIIPVVGDDPYAWKGVEEGVKDVWLRSGTEYNDKVRDPALSKFNKAK